MSQSFEKLADEVVRAAQGYVSRTLETFAKRIEVLAETVSGLQLKAGPPGEKGDKGDPGESIRGEKGDKGESIRGDKGDPGESIKGDKGDIGESIRGDKGDPGIDGLPGADGLRGLQGEMGPAGEKGIDGRNGSNGEKGIDGRDGLVGAVGERGERGTDGKDGFSGEKGLDGREGKDGRDGRDGKDGNPGRDAADIAPLSEIDLAKSYPIGTWAKHAGGLWLARTATDVMAGWDCIVEGVPMMTVTQVDQRRFEFEMMFSGGRKHKQEFSLPAMIQRGIWRDGEYERGDVVTWAGSQWHCEVEKTTTKPGGPEEHWRLIVKRGRDGKDGERVQEGKPGKDKSSAYV